MATALHRLAKLQPPGTAGPQSPVLRSASFQLLVEASQRLVPRFEAQAVSNTLWGARALSACPCLQSAHLPGLRKTELTELVLGFLASCTESSSAAKSESCSHAALSGAASVV